MVSPPHFPYQSPRCIILFSVGWASSDHLPFLEADNIISGPHQALAALSDFVAEFRCERLCLSYFCRGAEAPSTGSHVSCCPYLGRNPTNNRTRRIRQGPEDDPRLLRETSKHVYIFQQRRGTQRHGHEQPPNPAYMKSTMLLPPTKAG